MQLNVIIVTCISVEIFSVCTSNDTFVAVMGNVSRKTLSICLEGILSLVSELRIVVLLAEVRCCVGLRMFLAKIKLTVGVCVVIAAIHSASAWSFLFIFFITRSLAICSFLFNNKLLSGIRI